MGERHDPAGVLGDREITRDQHSRSGFHRRCRGRLCGRDRHGEHDARSAALTQGARGRLGGSPSGEPIIDQQHRAALDLYRRALAPVALGALRELLLGPGDQRLQFVWPDAGH